MALRPLQLASKSASPAIAGDFLQSFASQERLLNMFAVPNEQGAKSPHTLLPTPGIKYLSAVPANVTVRCMASDSTESFDVPSSVWVGGYDEENGNGVLYLMDPYDYTLTPAATIEGSAVVQILVGKTHLALACGVGGIYAVAKDGYAATQVSEAPCVSCAYQDGYAVFVETGTETVWASNPDDFTVINGLSFSSADSVPDSLVGCASDSRELFLFGKSSLEVWSNTGASPFPFSRASPGAIPVGCADPSTIKMCGGRLYWVAPDKGVYTLDGYTPRRVSTPAVEAYVGRAADVVTGYLSASVYETAGHHMYVVRVARIQRDDESNDPLCAVYDADTGLWHWGDFGGLLIAPSVQGFSGRATKWVCAYDGIDENDGTPALYSLEESYRSYDLSDTPATVKIPREIVLPPIHAGGGRAHMSRLVVDARTGVGDPDNAGSDVMLHVAWSDDLGATWSSPISRSLGASDEADHYNKRAFDVRRLGSFRQRSVKIYTDSASELTFDAPLVVAGVFADIEARE